jgi:hypothetical protein
VLATVTYGVEVTGGDFDYQGVWTYAASGWPTERTVECLDAR